MVELIIFELEETLIEISLTEMQREKIIKNKIEKRTSKDYRTRKVS